MLRSAPICCSSRRASRLGADDHRSSGLLIKRGLHFVNGSDKLLLAAECLDELNRRAERAFRPLASINQGTCADVRVQILVARTVVRDFHVESLGEFHAGSPMLEILILHS